MIKKYNKLVRDNIPEICKKNRQKAVTEILEDGKYILALKDKLREEVNEYLESGNAEELADILEVVEALANSDHQSFSDILAIKARKQRKNGGFQKKLFLKEVISDE